MKRRTILMAGGVGVVLVTAALTVGGAKRGTTPRVDEPRAMAIVTKDQGPVPALTNASSVDLSDVNVPANVQGFERLEGSAERGRVVFTGRLSCLDCHSVTRGEENGFPNLSDVGSRLSRTRIITSILEPSLEFAEGYKSLAVTTTDGRMIRGMEIQSESNDTVLVVKSGGQSHVIPRDQIEEYAVAMSDMPEGQVTGLSPSEFADLVEYLGNLKSRNIVASNNGL